MLPPARALHHVCECLKTKEVLYRSRQPVLFLKRRQLYMRAIFLRWLRSIAEPIPGLNTEITPAMKKAGKRHRTTCSLAYHFTRSKVADIAVVNLALSIGRKNAAPKITMIHRRILISFLLSINKIYFVKRRTVISKKSVRRLLSGSICLQV